MPTLSPPALIGAIGIVFVLAVAAIAVIGNIFA
jgi:hypothetical protein